MVNRGRGIRGGGIWSRGIGSSVVDRGGGVGGSMVDRGMVLGLRDIRMGFTLVLYISHISVL